MKTTNEETILEQNGMVNEETLVENAEKSEEIAQEPKTKQNRRWMDAAIGAGSGVAAGIIGTLFTSGTIPSAEDGPETGDNEGENGVIDDGLTTPVVTDGHLAIAHNVDDSMSFGEAFRTAHDEVGPGGVFEWHGQLYGTYTAAEWNNLTSEEKLEYNNHLRVVGKPDYASNVSHHQSHEQHVETHIEDVAVNTTETHDGGQQEVEVVGHTQDVAQTDDAEVQVLGVEYIQSEDGQEMAIGGMSVNGQEIYVLDADNDGVGDVAVMDVNGNGQLDANEIQDLSEHPVDMSIFENTNQDVCGGMSPAEPDYLPESL
ncbi:MAG: hypothetical protein J6W52_08025 [Bacteroidaceae bacterium]|nr:hypothetical protein [Bacteroidaceae bacterium]